MTTFQTSRRGLIAGAGATLLAASAARAATADLFPVVETADGKLRGLVSGGIKVFKGVPYGADTSGGNRFRPPQPVRNGRGSETPWTTATSAHRRRATGGATTPI